jgi:hypothetical protein
VPIDIVFNTELRLLTLLSIAVFFGSAEIGFRCGRRVAQRVNPETNPHIATIEAALLGLLALLLGFAFAMAMNRYDTRKTLVMEEANDIQTTYLRSQLLPERYRGETARLLGDYSIHGLLIIKPARHRRECRRRSI